MESDYQPKYINRVSQDSAEINLFDEIGNGGISGQEFADDIQTLNDFGVKEIIININSGGGSVIDGLSIFSAIQNSKAVIHTNIVGIAASMAGVIAMAGDVITMVNFGKLMIHNPHGSDDPSENEKKALNALRDSLITIFKNRTKKSKSELSSIMDEETWLTPVQALEGGFIDEIVENKHNDKKKRQAVAEIANILNDDNDTGKKKIIVKKTLLINNSNSIKMEKLAKHYDLHKDASEDAILEAAVVEREELATANADLETKTDELKTATDKVTELEASVKEYTDAAEKLSEELIEEAVEEMVTAGQIEEKDKESMVDQFKGDLPGLKLVKGTIKGGVPKISNMLKTPTASSALPENLKGKTFRELEKDHPEQLANMKEKDLDSYKALYKEEYNVEYAY